MRNLSDQPLLDNSIVPHEATTDGDPIDYSDDEEKAP
jgi:hypothetical protein